MAIGQNVTDYLEALGGQFSKMGLPSRRHSSPLETGLTSAVSGFAAGSKMKRATDTARNLQGQKRAFESKVGMPYDLFVKLSGQAQQEILKHSGVIPDPYGEPIEQFGGRSLKQLENQGAPGRTEQVPGGTGVFSGLPSADVQVGPPLPPLKAVGAGSRAGLMDRYLGVETPMSEKDRSLIDYRAAGAGIRKNESAARIRLMGKREKLAEAQTTATVALGKKRGETAEPAPQWQVEAMRSLGVMLPKDQPVTKAQMDTQLKTKGPASAVILRIGDLLDGAREAELKAGKNLSDEQLEKYVKMQTSELGALAGPNAYQIVLDAVKSQMAALRAQAANPPSEDDEEAVPEEDLPPEFDADEDELEFDPEEGADDMESGYAR